MNYALVSVPKKLKGPQRPTDSRKTPHNKRNESHNSIGSPHSHTIMLLRIRGLTPLCSSRDRSTTQVVTLFMGT
ncbi:protein of unknown function (plasmid) [Cupriavidus taiwanensis]|uniref:Uncharacterized protein n=1 Tax=Cupriavidus taiwanensis TaxID=164546 RepID=A0A375ECQ3_9BURK|nr:protein of unknown function [Cupriavidus taiwanensis]SOZ72403.1 protein of unknown function [Cupriavidus taiwanensis]SOZ74761.1 protein of unknown function [Cupriavidus taiwanensis]SPA03605.1 protein of unknown function [Cupriavidus taiwanensis]SPA11506.1 protein of unknown function [Cupriavidus taiwanensis]